LIIDICYNKNTTFNFTTGKEFLIFKHPVIFRIDNNGDLSTKTCRLCPKYMWI